MSLNVNTSNIKNEKENLRVSVFISYAMVDSKRLNISEIAKLLNTMKNINKIHFWEGWNGFPNSDIIEFMEYGITNCNVFIPVFTKASLNSPACEEERKIALYQHKRIIYIFLIA